MTCTPAEPRKQTIYLPAEMLAELRRESLRLERSVPWLMQQAWRFARAELREQPVTPGARAQEAAAARANRRALARAQAREAKRAANQATRAPPPPPPPPPPAPVVAEAKEPWGWRHVLGLERAELSLALVVCVFEVRARLATTWQEMRDLVLANDAALAELGRPAPQVEAPKLKSGPRPKPLTGPDEASALRARAAA